MCVLRRVPSTLVPIMRSYAQLMYACTSTDQCKFSWKVRLQFETQTRAQIVEGPS